MTSSFIGLLVLVRSTHIIILINFLLPGLDSLKHLIAHGCYGYKQLQDIIQKQPSKYGYKPVTSQWCSGQKMIPRYLTSIAPQSTDPPFEIQVFPFTLSEAVLVRVRSKDNTTIVEDVYISGCGSNKTLQPSIETCRVGRFIPSKAVYVYCCNFTNKNAASLQPREDDTCKPGNRTSYDFYWIPDDYKDDDYEGPLFFTATIVKNLKEYWTNVESKEVLISPRDVN